MKFNLSSKMLFIVSIWCCTNSFAEPDDYDWQRMFDIVTPPINNTSGEFLHVWEE